ncbi:MAG TPA: FAD:protein FMN transferase [Casimicrobiaceae bacterium]|nr:FAD:protein FMN transferase [Casimicrobiaceae bacterium]
MDRARAVEALLTHRDAPPAPFRYRFTAMASVHELHLSTPDRALADRVAAAAIADVRRIESKYSRYRDDSVTSAINRAAGRAAVAIDAETAALLRYADRCHAQSGGRFDITSGVLRRAWDFKRRPPRVPSHATLAAARELIGWDRVEWSDAAVRLPHAGMELDFGGIGKEYAADRAAVICRDLGIVHALVNLGGDVRAIGPRADGSPWCVGIRDPRREDATIASILVDDAAVATSGDYERYFEVGGRRYCHLLDPRTGLPVSQWQSVSVAAPLAILAGSYATIAMLLERDAEPFLAPLGVAFLMVAQDGSVTVRDASCAAPAFVVSCAR